MKAPGVFLLQRTQKSPFATYGKFSAPERQIGVTLELPDLENQQDVSCIPAGIYEVQLIFSPAHKRNLFQLLDIPGRSYIEFHVGNLPKDLLGCIAIGAARGLVYDEAENKNLPGIITSRVTFENWMTWMAGQKWTQFRLEIRDPQPVVAA